MAAGGLLPISSLSALLRLTAPVLFPAKIEDDVLLPEALPAKVRFFGVLVAIGLFAVLGFVSCLSMALGLLEWAFFSDEGGLCEFGFIGEAFRFLTSELSSVARPGFRLKSSM